ncbi:MAG: penicillin-binding protein 2 [Chloroflexota bacterium]
MATKKLRLPLLLTLLLFLPLLSSCSSQPSPYTAMEPYLKAWEEARYSDMYDLLSSGAQASIPRDKFVQRYQAITEGSTILSVKTSFSRDEKLAKAEKSASLPFAVVMATARLGEIREENLLPVVYEQERWKVDWSPSLIFRDLTGDNRILFEPEEPKRGSILDRKGRPLATEGKAFSVGVEPGRIEDEARLLAALEQKLGIPADQAKRAYQNAQPDWFVPLRDLSAGQAAAVRPELERLPGVIFREKPARVYPNGPTAAHVVGYVTRVTAEDLKTLGPQGYGEEDLVGRAGIEGSSEKSLAGERGARLSVVTPQGETVKVIAQKPARDGQNVQLSLDLDLQKLAEESLGAQAGSVVVMDVRDSTILALASYPRFDPNQFVTGFSDEEWKKLNDDPLHPFQNRPVASSYPVGSVFKVVTMAAGLDKGGFTPESSFDCDGQWDGLGNGQVMGDWLPQGHGHLNLFQGLVESCNIVFYEVGKKLDSIDPNLLPGYARGFGYGQPTGLEGLEEAAGLVPDPAWKRANRPDGWYLGDGVNLAIGQGFFLATPLQVANSYAALARGGALMTPVLVGKPSGQSVQFQTQQKGNLPVSAANLDVIRRAMLGVTADPKGTAYYAFQGSNLSVAAKTGSAEQTQGPDTHAWFAAFAPADQPRIALVAMVESKGHGAEVAAPVARKILDGYFK